MLYELHSAILELAPKHLAKAYAPSTFEELQVNRHSLVVWDGASDNTIYKLATVNHAFRAWHDSLHLSLNAPFTLEGETVVALEQARLVESDYLAQVILAEVVGQAKYYQEHGIFPIDQKSFIESYIKGRN